MTVSQWLPLSGLQANGNRINGAGNPGTSGQYFNGFVSGYIFKIAHNSRGGIPGWTRSPRAEKRCREGIGDGEEEMGRIDPLLPSLEPRREWGLPQPGINVETGAGP